MTDKEFNNESDGETKENIPSTMNEIKIETRIQTLCGHDEIRITKTIISQ